MKNLDEIVAKKKKQAAKTLKKAIDADFTRPLREKLSKLIK